MNDIAMEVELWSTLPADLLERTLSFLPVPVLCRFRTVCKKWSSLICKAEFGALCIQRARQGAGFIVIQEQNAYGFLDLSARRWYTIMHNQPHIYGPSRVRLMVAMDGGLVCQHVYAPEDDSVTVYISSPLAKTSRSLPNCPAIDARVLPRLSMVVDSIDHSFKIFLMRKSLSRCPHPFMVVYESTTNQWRISTTFPHKLAQGFRCREQSSISLDGVLYVLVVCRGKQAEKSYMLWRFNHVEDVWENTYVVIHVHHLESPQLIVSDNRLFLASWMRKAPGAHHRSDLQHDTWSQVGWSYEICEVHLGEKGLNTVFEMTEAVMKQLGDVDVRAVGCCNSVVLMCRASGVSLVYDLRTSLWDLLPVSPWVPQFSGRSLLWCASKHMNLTLPMWDLQHESNVAGIQSV